MPLHINIRSHLHSSFASINFLQYCVRIICCSVDAESCISSPFAAQTCLNQSYNSMQRSEIDFSWIRSWIDAKRDLIGLKIVTPEKRDDALAVILSWCCETWIDDRKTGDPKVYDRSFDANPQ